MSATARWMRIAVIAVSGLVCGVAIPASASAPAPDVRVTVAGTSLELDGAPWWPTGLNAYQLATDWSVNVGCGAMVDLDEYFSSLPAHSLTRFDAFQSLAVDKYTGQLDFGPVDAVFAAAEANDQLIIPVLAAQDGACEGGAFKDRQWYLDGWTSAPTVPTQNAVLSFEDWVAAAVARWKSSPALAAWELVGEPEASSCTDAQCDWSTRICADDAARILREFFDAAGAAVRSIDHRTPITAGLTGGGQCGSQGEEYKYLGESPFVDILQYHDYGADGIALPGDQWNGLGRRIAQTSELDKPLLVAEIGELAGACGSTSDRADHIQSKIEGQRAAGTAGALLWAFVPDPRPLECTFDIGPEDPLWQILR